MEKVLVAVYANVSNAFGQEIYKKFKFELESLTSKNYFVCYNGLGDFDDSLVAIKLYHNNKNSSKTYQLKNVEDIKSLASLLASENFTNDFESADATKILQSINACNPLNILLHNMQSTHTKICGDCFPCRLGGSRIIYFLNKAIDSGLSDDEFDMLQKVSYAMKKASKCAVGLLGADPMLFALENFKENLKTEMRQGV